ncbi:MAG: divalent-cation tolerance protein CutA [Desulfobulbaceae bacterium]|nr:divalent-cation tolerance protein CutA [Desulfobulbaceae bacterium]
MTSYLQVATTVESRALAEEVAHHVLDRRLAGCVQIVQCASMYHWQGKIEQSDEFLCIMKTRQDLFDELQAEITAIHPYEVPEILATPVAAGNPEYLDWLNGELRK